MSQGVEIQLKILQTILPLLTNYSVHKESLAEVSYDHLPRIHSSRCSLSDTKTCFIQSQALLLCFRLQDSRVVFVNNTAAATLRQLVIYIFERVGEEDLTQQGQGQGQGMELEMEDVCAACPVAIGIDRKQPLLLAEKSVEDDQNDKKQDTLGLEQINEEQLGPCALDAYLLFQDLCLLTNSEHARFLSLSSISRTFGLELIESVLTNHFHLFKRVRELLELLSITFSDVDAVTMALTVIPTKTS